MSNKKIGFNFSSPELAQKYSNLTLREIPLSATGVSSRVFFYLKDKKLIDYKVAKATDKKSWVKLNYFEAFWLMMIKEFRVFGIPDRHIKLIKSALFKTTAELYKEGHFEKEVLMKQLGMIWMNEDEKEEMHQEFDDYLEGVEKIPESDLIYLTLMGGIISILLLTSDMPVFVLVPNTNPETMKDAPLIIELITELVSSEIQMSNESINPHTSKLTIPLRPIFEKLFMSDIKNKLFLHYRLITDKENQILDLIQEGDFKEIVIKMSGDEPVFNVKNKGEFVGDKAKEIRKILGIKNYKNITLVFRNDKHIYYENESKI
ncbi:MAG: hypothetical protein P8P86_00120 [Flavobacteriales bacterium]|nr:hypothetical protein [Flavobacteriales bacterium]